jgi:hypothetical protein
MPDITPFKGEQCCGDKKSEERVTPVVGCSADGSERLPVSVIEKI